MCAAFVLPITDPRNLKNVKDFLSNSSSVCPFHFSSRDQWKQERRSHLKCQVREGKFVNIQQITPVACCILPHFPSPPIVESMIKVSPSALTEPYIHAQMPDSLHSRLLTSRRTCSDKLEMKAGSFVCNSKALSLLDTLPNISHKHCSAGRS